ncbi:hypothetical protein [Elizabethkingia miricola]|uniref:hypothetical protein n=1 Tax=Elizabethkingia miricola TaxID=172045 RepID=UPI0038927F07
MKKHLFYPCLLGILTIFLLFACRTDNITNEQATAEKEKIAVFERFEKINNIQPKASSKKDVSSEKYVSYAAPFSEIITNFLEKHSDYREKLEKEIGKIRLDVSSTTFGEGAKGVLFPVIDKNGKVIGAWGGIVNEERDYVKFYYLNNSSQEVTSIKNAFQSYYDRNARKIVSLAIAAKSTSLDPIAKKATDIEEVVITVYKPLTYYDLPSWWHDAGWTNPNPGPGPGTTMEGGPGTHGGGTNGTDNNNQQQDPCNKMKSITQSETYKSNTTSLQGKTSEGTESGFRLNLPIPNGATNQVLTARTGSNQVDMTIFSNTYGLMHSHYDGLYPIFSPGDIVLFNRWVNYVYRNNQVANPGDPIPSLDDIYLTVVTSNGNYILKFDPSVTPTQLPNYTQTEFNTLNTNYMNSYLNNAVTVGNVSGNVSYDMGKIEKEFLNFVNKEMNMPGLKLYRATDRGNTQLSMQNGKLIENKCP